MARLPKNLLIVLGFVFCCILIAAGALIYTSWAVFSPRPTSQHLVFPTRQANPVSATPLPASNPQATAATAGPQGKIVYVCQIFKLQTKDQICVINADGSGQRRLTTEDAVRHFYPSLSPDGKSVLFSSNLDGNFKIYEMSMDGQQKPVGDRIGIAPEVSPDNTRIAFVNNNGQHDMVWLMNRDGSNLSLLYQDAWDPTWSPDGKRILFATTVDGIPQLASINVDGTGYSQLTHMEELRGRSDWSGDGAHIVTYAGKSWHREIFIMDADGSNLRQITPPDGNSQGPSFSPDGQWVAFTAYFGSIGNNNGCEIYIMRIDGSGLKRLTENTFCDWQPRWGP